MQRAETWIDTVEYVSEEGQVTDTITRLTCQRGNKNYCQRIAGACQDWHCYLL